ncbi:MAG: hypothetical protein JSV89_02855 [Spirochaetaceae bacterium]|nr:MAG: hypothetical protein JSV89_02855 [Spirochaetaceae bacterium]
MNTQTNTALKILQLLLRCGMVGKEELNVVLEMMPAGSKGQEVSVPMVDALQKPALPQEQPPEPKSRRNTLILEFD